MRIRVVYRSGQQEILTLIDPVKITETNRENGMSHITDATGMDYYFNVSDGTYDGWGSAAPEGGITDEQANEKISKVLESTELVEPILP